MAAKTRIKKRTVPDPPEDTIAIGQAAAEVLREPFCEWSKWSVDQLLTHPAVAIQFCKTVSLRMDRRLKHAAVLRALLNARKQSRL